ncbi:MAG: hypothetical protein HRT94_06180 [Alphaproteobacteria bacterium]|nr:hypothetical protein [Alphaproteobacteria bacterium]
MKIKKRGLLLALAMTIFASSAIAQSAFDDPGSRDPQGNASGGLVAVNNNLDSGNVTLGSSSQVVLLFRNDGNKQVTMGAIDLYPSSNVSASIAQNQCAKDPLDSGAICAIALSVKGLQPGRFRVEMLIRHDGRSRLITSVVTGVVDSTDGSRTELINDVEAIPVDVDFGSLSESRTQVQPVVLRNVTSKKITLDSIFIDATPQSGYSLEADCDSLDSGEACIATLTWSPVQRGPATGVLVVKHDGPASVTAVPLNGSYEPAAASEADVFPEAIPGKGLLTASQSEVDFGTGIDTSSAITVSLVNVGDAPVTLTDIRMSNDKNGVEISRNGCAPGTMLDPVEACPMTLTWEPVREGDILDDIQIHHNGARGILVMPLRGTATGAVNKDSEAIFFGGEISSAPYFGGVPPLSSQDLVSSAPVVTQPAVTGSEQAVDSPSEGPAVEPTPAVQEPVRVAKPVIDVRGALDGFRITSLAPQRAIIAGPGGSRVVFSGEETVIGGILWDVKVRSSAVQFSYGEQSVLLLFDKSLTSFNSNGGQSIGGNTSSGDDN